ncbi:putative ABC transport system permease protein [Catalinimonas alkaloidigena]|uniref:Putative ABC transport system permease protein n=1 Tax=Catalinimonas alkaloidigena TaxID=1075417 RepID=A0A1G8YDR9_9BACT|nr:ABC transporter permease [Catalinimonas alkaloidigena]SDK00998.1 putative ABC transport system permease protein [Catalinimonas alkaloidigena]
MFRNHLKVTLRNLKKRKVFSLINLLGLALGMACCLLLGVLLRHEWAYDRFQEKGDRLFRVVTQVRQTGEESYSTNSTTGWPQGRALAADYPDVEAVTYLRPWHPFFLHEGVHAAEELLFAEPTFFQTFTYPLAKGDPATALQAPNSIVLTPALAAKYFPEREALGQVLTVNDSTALTVTGVLDPTSGPSHLAFSGLVSFGTLCSLSPGYCEEEFASGWFDLNIWTYVLLRPQVDVAAFEAKIQALPMRKVGDDIRAIGYEMNLGLQPVQEIYFSPWGNGLGPSGDRRYLYLLGAVALFVLTVAAINYMNLATARSVERAKEVSLRKVVGSSRRALIAQFLTESVVLCGLAVVLAFQLMLLALPYFNQLTEQAFTSSDLLAPPLLLFTFCLVVVLGGLAGLYPAAVLSGFKPAEALKGSFSTSRRGGRLRHGLVVFQFALSGVLIAATLVVLQQVDYMQGQSLGFDREQVLILEAGTTPGPLRYQQRDALMASLQRIPGVEVASATGAPPGYAGWGGQICFPEGRPREAGMSVEFVPADHDYVKTYGLDLMAGRDFAVGRDRVPVDTITIQNPLLINETAVREMGWETPEAALGKTIESPSGAPRGTVIGVLQDYHQHGLQTRIRPVVLSLYPYSEYYALRLAPGQIQPAVRQAEQVWQEFFPGYAFQYEFLDDAFDQLYRSEVRLARIFSTFAGLSIFVACLGLFGLAAYATQQRTKEIGVRKVLGATVTDLVGMLSKDFLKLVGLAFLVAAPLAYWLLDRWLDDFAYRMPLGPGLFLLTGVLMVLIAWLTVSVQSLRAAQANPVDSLKNE